MHLLGVAFHEIKDLAFQTELFSQGHTGLPSGTKAVCILALFCSARLALSLARNLMRFKWLRNDAPVTIQYKNAGFSEPRLPLTMELAK